MKRLNIENGTRFGKYVILSESEKKGKNRMFVVRCDCGNERIVVLDSLIRGISKGCGCNPGKHKLSYHKLYRIWAGIKGRCFNKNRYNYNNYGGRGISICYEWVSNPEIFIKWALENGYKPGLTIDRKNNNESYSPNNCRFISRKDQQNNRRINVKIEIDGEVKTIGEWAALSGLKYDTLWSRVRRYKYEGNKLIQPINHK